MCVHTHIRVSTGACVSVHAWVGVLRFICHFIIIFMTPFINDDVGVYF